MLSKVLLSLYLSLLYKSLRNIIVVCLGHAFVESLFVLGPKHKMPEDASSSSVISAKSSETMQCSISRKNVINIWLALSIVLLIAVVLATFGGVGLFKPKPSKATATATATPSAGSSNDTVMRIRM